MASVVAYYLFGHVRTRVIAWKDPFAVYDSGGYQLAQSLSAIGTGGWLGMGLCQGQPDKIPVAAEDFIFSAIAEELGIVFAMCLILICLSCYIMFLNIAMQLRNQFISLLHWAGNLLYFPGVPDDWRSDQVYSIYRSYAATG